MNELSFRKPSRAAARRRSRPGWRVVFDWMIVLLLFGLCGFLVVRMDQVHLREARGVPEIVDGDTLVLGGKRIRLRGIDAFERGQSCRRASGEYDCGAEATAALRRFIGGGIVDCAGRTFDRYRRLLAVCTAGDLDINAAMVDAGWAVAYGGYQAEETRAAATKTGAWQGSFDRPAEWRGARGGLAETPHDWLQRFVGLLRALLFGPAETAQGT